MEKTSKRIYLIPAEHGWSDIGTWQSLFRQKGGEKDSDGNLIKGNAILLDTRNSLIFSSHGRFIGVRGLENASVVDTEDVLLTSHLQWSHELRSFPEILEKRGWKQWI